MIGSLEEDMTFTFAEGHYHPLSSITSQWKNQYCAYITTIHIASRENCYLLSATEFNLFATQELSCTFRGS